jgi:sialate O-acetylesterase
VTRRSLSFLAGLLGAAVLGRADVVLAPPFQDHMVLQRDRALPVWGRAAPGERVRVGLVGNAPMETTADATGRWRVSLPARPADTVPTELVVEGANRIVVRDVLIGEVWLCSGQSNMEFRLRFAATAQEDIAHADLPQIRQLKIARNPAEEPRDQVGAQWSVCSPATAGEFTAVGFHFARELWHSLRVPIGIINSSHGNSPVESWMSRDALASAPEFAPVVQRWAQVLASYPEAASRHAAAIAKWEAVAARASAENKPAPPKPAAPIGPGHHQSPASLFNGMIHPLVPYALRGFLWYQGEGNARRSGEYEQLFKAQIRQWRQDFAMADAPFFWVQLPALGRMPPTTSEADWVALRAAQAAALALPHTGQAITIDVGDDTDIHPTRKREVGQRLARLARRQVYGEKVTDRGPGLMNFVVRGGAVELHFTNAAGQLKSLGALRSVFEIAGPDGRFVAADSVDIVGADRVVMRAKAIANPASVRFAWMPNPQGWLFNGEGLPAAPFATSAR